MSINFENALGIHDDALVLRSRRSGVLAQNIANADTPGYKARDMDFQSILRAKLGQPGEMRTTSDRHFRDGTPVNTVGQDDVRYRIPRQPSVDDNTVEVDIERAEFTRNAMQFQYSFLMLNRKFKGLTSALKGE